ncbi:MAG: EF-hand domain-containing protein [Kineosporiaceae bacterium]
MAEKYAATFQLIDTDEDGYITAVEFKGLLDMLGGGAGSVPEETASHMFSAMDADGDGKVNLEELSDYLSDNPA